LYQTHVGECQTIVLRMMKTGEKLPPDKRAKMMELLANLQRHARI